MAGKSKFKGALLTSLEDAKRDVERRRAAAVDKFAIAEAATAHYPDEPAITTPVREPRVVPETTPVPQTTVVQKAGEPLSETTVVHQTTAVQETGVDIKSHYAKVPIAFVDELCRSLDPYAQLVYLQLVRLSWGHKRSVCKISFPRLAERANISDSAARRAVRVLARLGLVEKVGADVDNPAKNERGVMFRVSLPVGTPIQETTPVRETTVGAQTTGARGAPMKEKSTKKDMKGAPAPRAASSEARAPQAPSRSEEDQKKLAAAVVRQLRRDRPGATSEELRGALAEWCEEQGVDPRFVDEAIR